MEKLPENLESIRYHVHIMVKIEKGLEDARAGRLVPHDEVMGQLKKQVNPEGKGTRE